LADTRRQVLEERARQLARVPDEPARAGEVLELVGFVLAGERYAIESRFVREVARLTRFTPVPGTPAFVLGVTNLRGEILALFDLRHLLGIVTEGVTDLGRIVVLGEHRREFGLLADAASDILYVPGTSLAQTEASWGRAYLRGVTPDGVVVLSGAALLNDPRLTIDAGEDPRPSSWNSGDGPTAPPH
jgi:purine-binding chemotaxis protein CheW